MRRLSHRGFSLVEVLFALVILAVVITTTLSMFFERNKRLQQANEIILAYQVLSNEAEWWRRVDYSNLQSSAAFETDTSLLHPMTPYATTITVQQTRPAVKNVTLTISWSHGARRARLTLTRVDTEGDNLW